MYYSPYNRYYVDLRVPINKTLAPGNQVLHSIAWYAQRQKGSRIGPALNDEDPVAWLPACVMFKQTANLPTVPALNCSTSFVLVLWFLADISSALPAVNCRYKRSSPIQPTFVVHFVYETLFEAKSINPRNCRKGPKLSIQ